MQPAEEMYDHLRQAAERGDEAHAPDLSSGQEPGRDPPVALDQRLPEPHVLRVQPVAESALAHTSCSSSTFTMLPLGLLIFGFATMFSAVSDISSVPKYVLGF